MKFTKERVTCVRTSMFFFFFYVNQIPIGVQYTNIEHDYVILNKHIKCNRYHEQLFRWVWSLVYLRDPGSIVSTVKLDQQHSPQYH